MGIINSDFNNSKIWITSARQSGKNDFYNFLKQDFKKEEKFEREYLYPWEDEEPVKNYTWLTWDEITNKNNKIMEEPKQMTQKSIFVRQCIRNER